MTTFQNVWPVNELDEIVAESGVGTSNIVGFISQDQIPVGTNGKIKLVGTISDSSYALPSNCTPAQFQVVHDAVVATGKQATLKFKEGETLNWASGITLNTSFVSVDFNYVTIDTSSMAAGIPFTFTGTVNPPYGQGKIVYKNLTLVGSGRAGTMTAMLLNGPNTGGSGPSRVSIKNVEIKEFGTGIKFGNNSYCQNFENIEIWHTGTGVYFPDGQADSGERPTFKNSLIFQSDVAVRVDGNHGTWLHFEGCSFDHNGRQFDIRNSAKVWVTDCHIEASDYTIAPFILTGDGTVLKMQGGQFVVTNTSGRTMPYIVDNSVTGGGGAYFINVNLYKAYTTNRYFSTGSGKTYVNGFTTVSTHDQPILVSSAQNALKDGGFENTIGDDLISIYKDTAGITDAFTGTNLSISYSATSPRTGSKCLKVTKVGAAATNAGFYIAIPIRNLLQRGSYKGYFKTTATGSFTVNPVYCRLQVDGNGVLVSKGTSASESQQSKSDTSGTWLITLSSLQNISTPPEWATHYAVFIDLTGKGAGDIYFDDIEMALM